MEIIVFVILFIVGIIAILPESIQEVLANKLKHALKWACVLIPVVIAYLAMIIFIPGA